MIKINEFSLSPRFKEVLSSMEYVSATKIQEQAIPLITDGKDILASSQTGTGKTGAFLIPLIAILENNKEERILITTPTRELAKQVCSVADRMLGKQKNIKTVLIIGGEDMSRQIRKLKQKPNIIIGTPGRINDHLKRKTLCLENTRYLVLDETDRMLDMGFGEQIDNILEFMPEKKQTLLFSATLPKAIIKLSKKYLNNPERVAIDTPNSIAAKITQNTIRTEDKFNTLVKELKKTEGSVLIFVRTKKNADTMKRKLISLPYKIDTLHGGLRQNQRTRVMKAFRDKRCNVLVATDVASRGLDVPHIEHVINYDMPENPVDYIHRIGRTARADKTGTALSIISKSDKYKWDAVQGFLNGDEDCLIYQKPSKKSRKSKRKRNKDKSIKQAKETTETTKTETDKAPKKATKQLPVEILDIKEEKTIKKKSSKKRKKARKDVDAITGKHKKTSKKARNVDRSVNTESQEEKLFKARAELSFNKKKNDKERKKEKNKRWLSRKKEGENFVSQRKKTSKKRKNVKKNKFDISDITLF